MRFLTLVQYIYRFLTLVHLNKFKLKATRKKNCIVQIKTRVDKCMPLSKEK